MIRIVGLGPSNLNDMSMGAYRAILSAPVVFVRTEQHPAAQELTAQGVEFRSMDFIYESADTFEEVYDRIARHILEEAERGDVVYAVPGHPLVGESAVRLIVSEAKERGLELEIIGSASFIESSLEALGVTLDEGLKVMDALSMDRVGPDPDTGNLIYQVYDRAIASETKLLLMETYPDEFEVSIVSGGAAPGEQVITVPLYRLDRQDFDHLTSVYIPPLR